MARSLGWPFCFPVAFNYYHRALRLRYGRVLGSISDICLFEKTNDCFAISVLKMKYNFLN